MKRLVIVLLALATLACDERGDIGPRYRTYRATCLGVERQIQAHHYRMREAGCAEFWTRDGTAIYCGCSSVVPEVSPATPMGHLLEDVRERIRVAFMLIETNTALACASAVCEACERGRAIASDEDRMGEFFHVSEDLDEDQDDLLCEASPIWLRYPAAVKEKAK